MVRGRHPRDVNSGFGVELECENVESPQSSLDEILFKMYVHCVHAIQSSSPSRTLLRSSDLPLKLRLGEVVCERPAADTTVVFRSMPNRSLRIQILNFAAEFRVEDNSDIRRIEIRCENTGIVNLPSSGIGSIGRQ